MKLFLGSVLFATLIVGSGCAGVVSPVGQGFLYTGVRGPVDAEAEIGDMREGRACAVNVLGAVASGDASIYAAKRNAGITKVSSVDHDSFSVLFFFSRFCTLVRGS